MLRKQELAKKSYTMRGAREYSVPVERQKFEESLCWEITAM